MTTETIKTKYLIIPADENKLVEERTVHLPRNPSYTDITHILEQFFPDFNFEHVNVWLTPDWGPSKDGYYTDMFVDELGVWKRLPINKRASKIYRANWLTHHEPKANADALPSIYGDAILFTRNVWN